MKHTFVLGLLILSFGMYGCAKKKILLNSLLWRVTPRMVSKWQKSQMNYPLGF